MDWGAISQIPLSEHSAEHACVSLFTTSFNFDTLRNRKTLLTHTSDAFRE